MNWKELSYFIDSLDEEQLCTDVTVEFGGEYYPVAMAGVAVDDDVLDEDHPVLTLSDDMYDNHTKRVTWS